MKFYKHTSTKTDLFIQLGDALEWLTTYVDGRHSKEPRTPFYCRLVPTGEIALVHVVKWVYEECLAEINEEEARALDTALVDRIARIERGEEQPRFHRTKYYGLLQEPAQP
jgi:hypothetical protein